MSSIINFLKIDPQDSKRWNDFFYKSIYPLYMGRLEYANSQKYTGRIIESYIIQVNGQDIIGSHYSLKSSFHDSIKIAEIRYGIFFTENISEDILFSLMNHFFTWSKNKSANFVRISVNFPKSIAGIETQYKIIFEKVFSFFKLKQIKNSRHTYWIDLTLNEDELMKRMHSQTRRNIRKAIKSKIVVEKYDNFIEEEVQELWQLYNKLGNTKGFVTLKKDRFIAEIESLFCGGASLFNLKYNGYTINVGLSTRSKYSSYYHGALNPEYKNLNGCPSPGHYLQWIMINKMKNYGSTIYDMAYCPGKTPFKEHPNFDMWRFKYGFGGDHIEFFPTYGKALTPIRGKLLERYFMQQGMV